MSRGSRRSSSLLDGVSWVLGANIVYLLVSAVLTLLLPKFLSPAEFGWWQLYQLFGLYLGYVTFGHTDGVNLRLAGRSFSGLPRRELSTGFVLLACLDAIVFMVLVLLALAVSDGDQTILFGLAAAGALAYVPRTLISVVFQSTRQGRAYLASVTAERMVLVVGVAVLLFAGTETALVLVAADVVAKYAGVLVSLILGRGVFFAQPHFSRENLARFFSDCRAGLFVLAANLSAMLIHGMTRMGILLRWDIVVFGQVSLGFQFASMFMVVVSAVAATLLPNLKRIDASNHASAYRRLRRRLVTPLVLMLPLCYPLIFVLNWWLPEYGAVGTYTALLFPVCVYESMNRGLTGAFLKALRLERDLLRANAAALAVAAVIAGAGIAIGSLELTVSAIVISCGVRALIGELVVSRIVAMPLWRSWFSESAVVICFMGCAALGWPSWGMFGLTILVASNAALVYGSPVGRYLPREYVFWKDRRES